MSELNSNSFRIDLSVRSYECDLQGIVNNAIYLNYLEHARHLFLQSYGVNFADMHDEGKDLVVIRFEIDYKYPLRDSDEFYILTSMEQESRLRFVFHQEIYKLPEQDKLVLKSKLTGTCISAETGKPLVCNELIELIQTKVGQC